MTIDLVIPYFERDRKSNELRFALRSIEKHLAGYRKIWIVGSLPDWIRGVEHIPLSDSRDPRKHEQNIFRKQVTAFENPEVSDTVLHYHTDHYLLQPYTAASFPYYTHRSLRQGQLENEGAYRTTLIRTEKLLKSMLLGTRDFDCHCPIVYDKMKFLEAFYGVEWKDYGYGIKSVYCGFNGVKGVECEDLKLTGRKFKEFDKRIAGRGWFSTGNSNPQIELFLAGLFPRKSQFEK